MTSIFMFGQPRSVDWMIRICRKISGYGGDPADFVAAHNFNEFENQEPAPPTGMGKVLRDDLEELINTLGLFPKSSRAKITVAAEVSA
jgi:hypothetical protein